jgi:hypothetical protein
MHLSPLFTHTYLPHPSQIIFLFPNSPYSIFMPFFLNLDSAYERKDVIFLFLSLAYFTQHYGLQFHLFSCKWHASFLHFFIVYAHHVFFIHSSIDGHLGWFHNLSIVNSAVVNIGMQVSLLYTNFDSLGGYSGVVQLDHNVFPFLLFLRNLHIDSHSGCTNLTLI